MIFQAQRRYMGARRHHVLERAEALLQIDEWGQHLVDVWAKRVAEEREGVSQPLARDARLVQRRLRGVWQGDFVGSSQFVAPPDRRTGKIAHPLGDARRGRVEHASAGRT
jgi:hypothetical protein